MNKIYSVSNKYRGYLYSYPHKTAYGSLEEVRLAPYLENIDSCSLYLHIPFCTSKCGYCNLFSMTGADTAYLEQYLDAVKRQAAQYMEEGLKHIAITSVTIGGGTPLILEPNQLENTLALLHDSMKIPLHRISTCVETSPQETSKEKLGILKDYNIQRVSIGIQSFHDEELLTLRRYHNVSMAQEALSLLKKADFPCLNIDLIYGIPNQTISSFSLSLEKALSYEPDELYLYPLYVREHTGMYDVHGKVRNPETDQMYEYARDYLSHLGYIQTSMRRFSKHSSPVTSSCGTDNSISLGCGGRSYLGNLHFCTPYAVSRNRCGSIIEDYIQTDNYTWIPHGILLNIEEQKRRFILKNLLHINGVSRTDYFNLFGSSPEEDFPLFLSFTENNYTEQREDSICLTPSGLSLSDAIGPMFISEDMKRRTREWREP